MFPSFLLVVFFHYGTTSLAHEDHPLPSTHSPQGQREGNILRDATSQSDLPTKFGRTRSMQLARKVVSKNNIWDSVDEFTREVHRHPNNLDWLAADIRLLPGKKPRVVTVHAAFACMDRGKSTSTPIQFSGARLLLPLLNQSLDTGSVRYSGPSTESPDITMSCLLGRSAFDDTPWPGYTPMQAEYQAVHRGEPVRFVPLKRVTGTYLDDNEFFDRVYEERSRATESERVMYDSKENIPIVVGLPFTTGFKSWVGNDTSVRVPQLPLSAIRLNTDGQLESFEVDHGSPPTTSAAVWLNSNSTGLQLVVACFIAVSIYVQDATNRARHMGRMPVDDAVNVGAGPTCVWRNPVNMSVASVAILSIPIAIDAFEGKLDPRQQFEVITTMGVYYGVVQPEFSLDRLNAYAGAPFIVTSSLSVRRISDGHLVDLLSAWTLLAVVIVLFTMAQTRDISALMPTRLTAWEGVSPWKLYGSVSLWNALMRTAVENPTFLHLRIVLRGDALRGNSGLALSAVAAPMRDDALKWMSRADRKKSDRKWEAFAGLIQAKLERICVEQLGADKAACGRVELLANVRMDNTGRFRAMMARAGTWAAARIPREWEYVTRGVFSILPNTRNMDWYRAYGAVAPDEVLVMSKVGLLAHMAHVEGVVISDDEARASYAKDDCRMIIKLVPSTTPAVEMDLPNGPRFERLNVFREVDPASLSPRRFNFSICGEDLGADVVIESDVETTE